MIHSIYTMTIGRYGQLEKTQDARILRRWFNPLPVKMFTKRIERFFQDVSELFGSGGTELTDQLERAYMVNKMLQVSILYDALYACMVLKTSIDITLLLMDKEPKEVKNLDFYKVQVKELTGIEIKELGDIVKLKDEMTRLADKFKERFRDEETGETDDKPSFIRGAMAVFSLMEIPYNADMTLSEFAELKALADDRRKQLEKQLEKYGTD